MSSTPSGILLDGAMKSMFVLLVFLPSSYLRSDLLCPTPVHYSYAHSQPRQLQIQGSALGARHVRSRPSATMVYELRLSPS